MKTVLIADDEKEILEAFRLVFGSHSAEMRLLTAANGREAIDILSAEPVDLVVTDLNMPVLDGFQVLAHIMRNHPRLPVIVTTAYGSPLARDRVRSFGPLTFIEKPFDLLDIVEKIQLSIGRSAKGHVEGITLPSFLQLLEVETKSCSVRVSSQGRSGHFEFESGELVDAVLGPLRGESAAFEILGWEDVEIRIDVSRKSRSRTIHRRLEQVILEAAQRRDEARLTKEGEISGPLLNVSEKPSGAAVQGIIESIPDGVVIEKNGLILDCNSAAAELLGHLDRQALTGGRLLELFPAERRDGLSRYFRRIPEGFGVEEPLESMLIRADGVRVEVEIRARRLEHPRESGSLAIFLRDISEMKRSKARQAVEVALARLLTENSIEPPEISRMLGVLAERLNWQIAMFWRDETGRESLHCEDIWISPGLAAAQLVETSRATKVRPGEGLPGRARAEGRAVVVSDIRVARDEPRMSTAAGCGLRSAVAFPVSGDSSRIGVLELMSISPLGRDDGLLAWLSEFGETFSRLLEHASSDRKKKVLIEREQETLSQIYAEETRSSFLADASAVFASSLDESVLLRAFSRLAVPRLADWYVLDVVESNGELRRARVDHANPLMLEWAEELRLQVAPFEDGWSPVLRVVRTGESELFGNAGDTRREISFHDAHSAAVVEQLGFESAMIVPLAARNRVLGAVTLVSADSGRKYGLKDLETARELAHRAALAMENARRVLPLRISPWQASG